MQMIRIFIPLLTIATLLAAQTAAFADYQVSNGSDGHYKEGRLLSYEYEVWLNETNKQYTLKVWQSKNYPNGSPEEISRFKSAREALDHFDCYYSEKEAICEQMRRESH
jgi:hypothetical protein